MFSFEGAYRRTPIQSLGGASRSSDRDTLIRKAAEERARRADNRRQQHGATLIQSYARSFILRQRSKREQRALFDAELRALQPVALHRPAHPAAGPTISDAQLELLLKRLLYFYYAASPADGDRLIQLGQQLIRQPAQLLANAIGHPAWRLRLKRLLCLCTGQLCEPALAALSPTIPFRLLETYTVAEQLGRISTAAAAASTATALSSAQRDMLQLVAVTDPGHCAFLGDLFAHLVRHEYFRRLRRVLDAKVPPLDGPVQTPPNAVSATLLAMVLQPLRLVREEAAAAAEATSRLVLGSFVEHMLVPVFSDAMRSFVLPCLAVSADFPYVALLRHLDAALVANRGVGMVLGSSGSSSHSPQQAHSLMDSPEQAAESSADTSAASAASTASAASVALALPFANLPRPLHTSAYLLNAVLALDAEHRQRMQLDARLLAAYIRVVATLSTHLSRLPAGKAAARLTAEAAAARRLGLFADYQMDYEGLTGMEVDDGDDDEDEEDEEMGAAAAAGEAVAAETLETDVLLEVVAQLNDPVRAQLIGERVEDWFLQDTEVLHCVCQICHHLMLYNRVAQRDLRLLTGLYFKPRFIRTLWVTLANQSSQLRFSSPLSLLARGIYIPQDDIHSVIPILATFCSMFDQLIQTLHDGEFCQEDMLPGAVSKIMPFTLPEIATISTGLKDIALGLVDLAFPETRQSINDHYRSVRQHHAYRLRSPPSAATAAAEAVTDAFHKIMWPHLLKVCVSLLRQLYTRDLRRGFCAPDHWTVDTLNLPLDKPHDLHLSRGRRGPRPFQPIKDFTKEDFESGGPPLSTKQIRSITILREIPFVVPFNTRVGILQGLLSADKLRAQGDLQGFLQGPSIQLTVRRSHLYEDGFDKLRSENEPDLRPRFRIQMINEVGLDEVGIDGGGVFREFLSELIKAAFDPNRGFFMTTTDNRLYPNPAAGVIAPNFQLHYYFIGRILGKAIYENLLVELPLAEFFLSKLAGKKSTVDVHQLASLDPVLHHNLLGLKWYDGDVAELGLDFTVVSNELGGARVEELVPDGANIPVTNANKMEYIRQMADYKLNRQIRLQCAAFRRGLSNVVTVEWLHMFSNKEFQVLISGAEIAVDVEDLEAHTRYGGDFGPEHATIRHFWRVLHGFSDLQRRQLLKFVTSCSRPPLLGFKDLDPPFCIQNAGDTDRLPSASTCMNLLKLPAFASAELLSEKLLYAIESGSGFELS